MTVSSAAKPYVRFPPRPSLSSANAEAGESSYQTFSGKLDVEGTNMLLDLDLDKFTTFRNGALFSAFLRVLSRSLPASLQAYQVQTADGASVCCRILVRLRKRVRDPVIANMKLLAWSELRRWHGTNVEV